MYDNNNIFAKILRQELPCDKVYEDQYCLAFNDKHPAAPTHILFVPRGQYTNYQEFLENAESDEIAGFFRAISTVAKQKGLDETGYRIVTNNGSSVGQTVFHFHMHLLAGKEMSELG